MVKTLRLAILAIALAAPALAAEPGSVSITTAQVSVAATATAVATNRPTRVSITITNAGTTDVYCGADNTVTTSTGTLLTGTKGASITIPTKAPIFCIVGASTQTVTVLESF